MVKKHKFKYKECTLTIEGTSYDRANELFNELVKNHINEFQGKNRKFKNRKVIETL